MKINVTQLHSGPRNYEYSNLVELAVAHMYAIHSQKIVESISHGCDPTHDMIISGDMYEGKIQSSKDLCVEYARYDGRPSGITTTRSKYHLFINPGWNNVRECMTGKPRLIETSKLWQALYAKFESGHKHVAFRPTATSPGSRVMYIDPHDIPGGDGWLGFDVAMSVEKGDTIYDLYDVIKYKQNIRYNKEALQTVLTDITRRKTI